MIDSDDMQAADASRGIPRRVIQTFSTTTPPECLLSGVASWSTLNPRYSYEYSTDGDQRRFLLRHFDRVVLAAYDALVPGAFRADLWRYCSLSVHGGIYADIKSQCVMPLDQVLEPSLSLAVVLERDCVPAPALFNAWIAATPAHPWIEAAIDECLRSVQTRRYGLNPLDVTGPCAFGRAVYRLMNWRPDRMLEPGVHDLGAWFGRIKVLRHVDGDRVVDAGGHTVLYTRVTPDPTGLVRDRDFFRTITGIPHYSDLWDQRRVYVQPRA